MVKQSAGIDVCFTRYMYVYVYDSSEMWLLAQSLYIVLRVCKPRDDGNSLTQTILL